jgi:hypothetical protein
MTFNQQTAMAVTGEMKMPTFFDNPSELYLLRHKQNTCGHPFTMVWFDVDKDLAELGAEVSGIDDQFGCCPMCAVLYVASLQRAKGIPEPEATIDALIAVGPGAMVMVTVRMHRGMGEDNGTVPAIVLDISTNEFLVEIKQQLNARLGAAPFGETQS